MNPQITAILEILKYILPALVVLGASYSIINKFLTKETQKQQIDLMRDTQDTTIRLRLQAYERLVLFIERIHPRNLIPRVYMTGMTVGDLRQALVFNINQEFEHNLSQQLYVSKTVWETVKNVKEQELNMINNIAQQLNQSDSAKELHRRMVDYVLTVEGELPTDIALQIINDEAKRVMTHGSF